MKTRKVSQNSNFRTITPQSIFGKNMKFEKRIKRSNFPTKLAGKLERHGDNFTGSLSHTQKKNVNETRVDRSSVCPPPLHSSRSSHQLLFHLGSCFNNKSQG